MKGRDALVTVKAVKRQLSREHPERLPYCLGTEALANPALAPLVHQRQSITKWEGFGGAFSRLEEMLNGRGAAFASQRFRTLRHTSARMPGCDMLVRTKGPRNAASSCLSGCCYTNERLYGSRL